MPLKTSKGRINRYPLSTTCLQHIAPKKKGFFHRVFDSDQYLIKQTVRDDGIALLGLDQVLGFSDN